jgi:hypothetical protein
MRVLNAKLRERVPDYAIGRRRRKVISSGAVLFQLGRDNGCKSIVHGVESRRVREEVPQHVDAWPIVENVEELVFERFGALEIMQIKGRAILDGHVLLDVCG